LAYSTRSWLCSLYGEAEGTEFAALYLETEYLRPVEQGGLPGYLFLEIGVVVNHIAGRE
jgi:hypothetical protein